MTERSKRGRGPEHGRTAGVSGPPEAGARRRPRWQIVTTLGLLLVVSCYLFLLRLSTVDIHSYAAGRHGGMASRVERDDGADSVFRRTLLTLTSAEGLVAHGAMLTPVEWRRRAPVFILLGGKVTGKDAVNYVTGLSDAVVLALDYPYAPRHRYDVLDVVVDLPEVRKAFLDMVPSVMLAVDHVSGMPLVDTNRIVLVGYSFGAPFVPAAMSVDRRIDAAVMAYGGGRIASLVHHNVRRTEGAAFSWLIASCARVLLRPIEPVRYAADIAPRYALMINGSEDERIPRENVDALRSALHEPSEQVWIRSAHVHPTNVELTRMIVEEMKAALGRRGFWEGE